jgi:hypothetical protein
VGRQPHDLFHRAQRFLYRRDQGAYAPRSPGVLWSIKVQHELKTSITLDLQADSQRKTGFKTPPDKSGSNNPGELARDMHYGLLSDEKTTHGRETRGVSVVVWLLNPTPLGRTIADAASARSRLVTGSVFLFMAVIKESESQAGFALKRKNRP